MEHRDLEYIKEAITKLEGKIDGFSQAFLPRTEASIHLDSAHKEHKDIHSRIDYVHNDHKELRGDFNRMMIKMQEDNEIRDRAISLNEQTLKFYGRNALFLMGIVQPVLIAIIIYWLL